MLDWVLRCIAFACAVGTAIVHVKTGRTSATPIETLLTYECLALWLLDRVKARREQPPTPPQAPELQP